ncbi:FAD:protein FMN transferase [Vibrio profundum]|uniref:FAD:protein FMN transferase n=1 Tax=Vibrio profundum TaxID=2910247 RepID=UPI003D14FEA2
MIRLDKIIRFCGAVFLSVLLLGCSEPQQTQVSLQGATMGTYYSIKLVEQDHTLNAKEIQKGIDVRLERINDLMSTYRPDSELSRFNQYRQENPYSVSSATATVVREALRLSKLSAGAYDVTVGPSVNLWSFGPENRPDTIPNAQSIAQRKAQVGYNKLHVLGGNQLQKDVPGLYVDLSSIAKGYGVDDIAHYLQSEWHIKNFMVDIGGEIKAQGHNRLGQPWRIAIEKPVAGQRSVQEVLAVKNKAIATSGDYRNYFEQQGKRFSHLIDPRTGRPITNRVVSVTVLDDNCMTADGYATMFSILGEQESIALADQEQIPVMLIVKTDQGFKEYRSEAFQRYVQSNK